MLQILHTSSDFACVIADGADWREVGRKIVESLEPIRTAQDGMHIGFLYVSAELGGETSSLLSLLRNVSGIKSWYGATGAAICGNGKSVFGTHAAVVMIGKMPQSSFYTINMPLGEEDKFTAEMQNWRQEHPSSMLAITHGLLCPPASDALAALRAQGVFTAGGFASGKQGGLHIAGGNVVSDSVLSGVLFANQDNMFVATAQGCLPTGPLLTVTGCKGNLITSLNDEPAFDALRQAIEQIQLPPLKEDTATKHERRGHIHAAFPVQGLDTGANLVRNITQADEESKTLSVAHPVARGDRLQFVYRDAHTALDGLASNFQDLRDRAIRAHSQGRFEPKALLHFGCGARIADLATGQMGDEAALAARIFGDIPMAGFYTSAEICNGYVYGYTGVSVLIT